MLTKLYRHGATRQQVRKAYVVSGDGAPAVISRLSAQWPPNKTYKDIGQISLAFDKRNASDVILDTGLTWLHNRDDRDHVFGAMAEAVCRLVADVTAAGCQLLPNGYRNSASGAPLSLQTCGDDHIFETPTDAEREVFSNALRNYTPALIALSGRAAYARDSMDRLCSTRLNHSSRHYAARYFASVTPRHIDRVLGELRRDEGISRVDLLDVNPIGISNTAKSVHVRCIDGQIFVSTTRAHAILCQALFIQGRRLARAGRRVAAARQSLIEKNRARAIVDGLLARFELDRPIRE